jgi:hypothetical protein
MEAEPGTESPADGEALDGDRDRGDGEEPQMLREDLERLTAERDVLRTRLAETEQHLAEMPDLRAAREELEALRGSLAWRASAPLRRLAEAVRREVLPAVRLAIKRALLRLAARVRGRRED